jgi:hypothetical protein
VTSQPTDPPQRVLEFLLQGGVRKAELRRVLNWYMLPRRDYARLKMAMEILDTLPGLILRLEALERARAQHDADHEERLRGLEDWRTMRERGW